MPQKRFLKTTVSIPDNGKLHKTFLGQLRQLRKLWLWPELKWFPGMAGGTLTDFIEDKCSRAYFSSSYFITSFFCFVFVFALELCCLQSNTVSLSILYSFFLFYFTGWDSSTMLNKSTECGHPCFVPSCKRDSIQSFTRKLVLVRCQNEDLFNSFLICWEHFFLSWMTVSHWHLLFLNWHHYIIIVLYC